MGFDAVNNSVQRERYVHGAVLLVVDWELDMVVDRCCFIPRERKVALILINSVLLVLKTLPTLLKPSLNVDVFHRVVWIK
jgi:hypothetical protein